MSPFSHEFLWQPTSSFYIGTFVGFFLVRSRYNLSFISIFPALMVPVTLDFAKREYFVRQTPPKERKELEECRVVVKNIMAEKKRTVTFEQVMRHVLGLNLDRAIPREKQMDLMPMVF